MFLHSYLSHVDDFGVSIRRAFSRGKVRVAFSLSAVGTYRLAISILLIIAWFEVTMNEAPGPRCPLCQPVPVLCCFE